MKRKIADKVEILELIAGGKTLQQVADICGVSRQRIGQISKKAGLDLKTMDIAKRRAEVAKHAFPLLEDCK